MAVFAVTLSDGGVLPGRQVVSIGGLKEPVYARAEVVLWERAVEESRNGHTTVDEKGIVPQVLEKL